LDADLFFELLATVFAEDLAGFFFIGTLIILITYQSLQGFVLIPLCTQRNAILPDVEIKSLKIHAYLAKAGLASRRHAETLVAAGEITVNGVPAMIGQRVVPGKDVIKHRGKTVELTQTHVTYAVHKPPGFLSTTDDPDGRKTVLSLIKVADRVPGLHIVGRLDQESEGLLLLTTDGELTYRVTHPKFQIPKTYQVLVQGVPSTPALQHLQRGVKLSGEYVTPISVKILGHEEQKNTWLEIVIAEGQKHVVRKMCRRIGYEVLRLIRTEISTVKLADLPSGMYRPLTAEELKVM
jgi:pseudouridine synthase